MTMVNALIAGTAVIRGGAGVTDFRVTRSIIHRSDDIAETS